MVNLKFINPAETSLQNQISFVNGYPYWVRNICEGGMGIVSLLEETEPKHSLTLRRFIAAKTFKQGFNKDAIRRELQMWVKLNHPNILPLLSIGNIDDKFAAISPWRKDGTLSDIFTDPLAGNRIKKIIEQICRALDYAWTRHGIVHLDLKPNNVFVGKLTGEIEVGDWGISSISSKHELASETKKIYSGGGTLPYMAPERFFRDYQPAIQSDMYSLGLLILQLHSLPLPFRLNEDIAQVIIHGEYEVRIGAITKNLPYTLMKLVKKLTAPQISMRPKSYSEIISSLS